MESNFKYLEVLEFETENCVKRIDVTGKPESQIDKAEMGMLRNMNREDYFTRQEEYQTAQPII